VLLVLGRGCRADSMGCARLHVALLCRGIMHGEMVMVARSNVDTVYCLADHKAIITASLRVKFSHEKSVVLSK
jgi:uncharacterized Fe-S cluster-containing radical SAM superfamily enzyme